MIDISGQKVVVPALLFAAFQFKIKKDTLFLHAAALGLVYFLISKFLTKTTLTKADLVVPAILFLILTPGILVTLPPKGELPVVVAIHTFIFAIVFATLRSVFPQYY